MADAINRRIEYAKEHGAGIISFIPFICFSQCFLFAFRTVKGNDAFHTRQLQDYQIIVAVVQFHPHLLVLEIRYNDVPCNFYNI